MGAWTRRSSRGTISGVWATCGNVGNIIGLQLASFVLERNDQHWERLMYIIAIVYFGIAVLIFSTFVALPQEVGIDMTDDFEVAD